MAVGRIQEWNEVDSSLAKKRSPIKAISVSIIAFLVFYIFAYKVMKHEWTPIHGHELFCYAFDAQGVTRPPREDQRLWGFLFAPAEWINCRIREFRGLQKQIHYTGGIYK